MKAETLNKINEALRRLDEGTYGNCFECGDEIAQPRLRALPFAVRCKDCEEAREVAEKRGHAALKRVTARAGRATASFTLGMRAGTGNQRVEEDAIRIHITLKKMWSRPPWR